MINNDGWFIFQPDMYYHIRLSVTPYGGNNVKKNVVFLESDGEYLDVYKNAYQMNTM